MDVYYGDKTGDGLPNNIKIRTRSVIVGEIQKRLGIKVDNDFGPKTLIAVEAFQVKHGLKDDGIVGQKTFSKIYQK